MNEMSIWLRRNNSGNNSMTAATQYQHNNYRNSIFFDVLPIHIHVLGGSFQLIICLTVFFLSIVSNVCLYLANKYIYTLKHTCILLAFDFSSYNFILKFVYFRLCVLVAPQMLTSEHEHAYICTV